MRWSAASHGVGRRGWMVLKSVPLHLKNIGSQTRDLMKFRKELDISSRTFSCRSLFGLDRLVRKHIPNGPRFVRTFKQPAKRTQNLWQDYVKGLLKQLLQ